MARARSSNADTVAFIEALYAAGGFVTWAEFAREAGDIPPPQLSTWKTGEAEPAGANLLALIRAAAARSGEDEASLALRAARESFSDLLTQAVVRIDFVASRLEVLRDAVETSLGNQEAGIEMLDELLRLVGGGDAQSSSPNVPKQ